MIKLLLLMTSIYTFIFFSFGFNIYSLRLREAVSTFQAELARDVYFKNELSVQKKIEILKGFGFQKITVTTESTQQKGIIASIFPLQIDGQVIGSLLDEPTVFTISAFIFGSSFASYFFYVFYLLLIGFFVIPLVRYKKNIQKLIRECKKRGSDLDAIGSEDKVSAEILSIFKQKIADEMKLTVMQFEMEKKTQLGVLAKQVAHDIRSPLSVVNLIAHQVEVDTERKQLLIEASKRINLIADNLLKMSKSESSVRSAGLTEGKRFTDVQKVASQILSEKKFQFGKGAKFSLIADTTSDYLTSAIDSNNFAAILSNLINNSIEAIPHETGHIEIELRPSVDWLEIEVRDNGYGIKPELIQKLGVLGFSFGKETSTTSGNGLGLNSAIQQVESVGGQVEISSKLNVGTKIKITLPRTKQQRINAASVKDIANSTAAN